LSGVIELSRKHQERTSITQKLIPFQLNSPTVAAQIHIELTDPGNVVLDPMMGSATTLLEAIR